MIQLSEKKAASHSLALLQETLTPLSGIKEGLEKEVNRLTEDVYDLIDEGKKCRGKAKDELAMSFSKISVYETQLQTLISNLKELEAWLESLSE